MPFASVIAPLRPSNRTQFSLREYATNVTSLRGPGEGDEEAEEAEDNGDDDDDAAVLTARDPYYCTHSMVKR